MPQKKRKNTQNMSMHYKGKFKPHNPKKYKGNPTNIIYRSMWELNVMRYLDTNNNVVWWQSEEVIVPYKSPIDGRWHRYFPDFLICVRKKDGTAEKVLVEVKPLDQTMEPKKRSRVTQKYLNEVKTWGINSAKWRAAETFCEEKGWRFLILTEREIYGKKR